jgi:signal transduction histidine kinase
VLGYVAQSNLIRQQTSNQLVGLNSAKKAHIESFFRQVRTNAGLLAADPQVAVAVQELSEATAMISPIQDRTRLAKALEQNLNERQRGEFLIPANPRFARLQEYGAIKRGLIQSPISQDLVPYDTVWRKHFTRLKDIATRLYFYDIMLFSAESQHGVGSILGEPEMGADIQQGALSITPHFQAVQNAFRGRSQLVDFQRYVGSGNMPSAFICVPIKQNGKIIGALSGQISIDAISKVASGNMGWEREGLGQTGETIIVGNDSTLRTDTRFLTSDFAALQADLLKNGVSPENVQFIKATKTTVLAFPVATSSMQIAAANGESVTETKSFRGRRILAAFDQLGIPDLNWQIVTKKEIEEIEQPLVVLRRNTLLYTLLVSLVVSALSIWIARRVTRPINQIIDASRRIAAGESGVRANIKRADELGKLGNMFDHMVERDEQMDAISNGIRRNIVHDLKTPVTVIKGMAETLEIPEVGEDPEMRKEMLGAITQQSERLLDDLKDILHPLDDDYAPIVEEFDLSALVESIAKVEKHTGRAANHQIQITGSDRAILVTADKRKIRRVIENLLSNAIKYSPGDNKTVRVEIEEGDAEVIRVHVEDEGMGMTMDDLHRILSEGGRVEEHAKMGIEGTGLGLGSVRMILQAHQGELLAESEPGKGSRFTAVLPRSPGNV